MRRVDCRRCGSVKRERLDFLADNAYFTKRFAFYVGRPLPAGIDPRCRPRPELDSDTVKTLENDLGPSSDVPARPPRKRSASTRSRSERRQLPHRGQRPRSKRPISFGGTDRFEASMAALYNWLGRKKSRKIRLAVMDI